jgi:hypothetical protein
MSEPPEGQHGPWAKPFPVEVILAVLTVACWLLAILGLFHLLPWEGPAPWLAAILSTLLTFSVSGRLHQTAPTATRLVRGAKAIVLTLLLMWIGFVVYVSLPLID